MEGTETAEQWKEFLNKNVKVIVDDKPSPYPKSKEGLLKEVTETHLILHRPNKLEAIRLSDVRRIELAGGGF